MSKCVSNVSNEEGESQHPTPILPGLFPLLLHLPLLFFLYPLELHFSLPSSLQLSLTLSLCFPPNQPNKSHLRWEK